MILKAIFIEDFCQEIGSAKRIKKNRKRLKEKRRINHAQSQLSARYLNKNRTCS